MQELLDAGSDAGTKLRVISIFPRWETAEGTVRLRALAAAQGGTVELPPHQHAYFDYQSNTTIKARFPSLGFVVGRDLTEADRGHDGTNELLIHQPKMII